MSAVEAPKACLDVDLGAIRRNWLAIGARAGVEAAAVLKADAYGLGDRRVARTLAEAGCASFFVAHLAEARRLARGSVGGGVVHGLTGVGPDALAPAEARARRIRPVIGDLATLAAWAQARDGAAERTEVALQVDVGMNRLGLAADELADAIALLAGAGLEVALILGHLSNADAADDPLSARQRARFEAALATLRPAFPRAKASLAATGGALLGPAYAYDLVRPGVGLFGGLPFAEAEPVVALAAPILALRRLAPGESSGYGATFVATRPTLLAAVPLGYADGLPRALSNRGAARVGARLAPIAGRVSMDLTMLDVSGCDDVRVGAPALFLERKRGPDALTIDRVAACADTIGYELITGLGRALSFRQDRRYRLRRKPGDNARRV